MKDSELPQSELLDSEDFSNNYSARNKKVAIQLNEYLYYHGPSDASHTDRRLIGRRKLIDKLASLISSSEVATGVYLVSGFRGSGKTSIVNSVISKFNQETKFLKGNYLVLFIIICVYVVISCLLIKHLNEFFSNSPTSFTNYWIFIIIQVISIVGFYMSFRLISRERSRRKIKTRLTFTDIVNLFIIKENVFKEEKNKYGYLIYLNVLIVPLFFSSLIVLIGHSLGYYPSGHIHYIFLNFSIDFFIILLLINVIKNAIKKYENEDGGLYTKLLKFLRDIVNMDRYVFIYLNLGHSKLSEIDILRLLARNLQTSLKHYYHKKFILARTAFRILYILVIYFITYLFYYNQEVYKAHSKFRTAIHFNKYFPSQTDFYLKADTTGRVDELYKDFSNRSHCEQTLGSDHNVQSEFHKNIIENSTKYGVISSKNSFEHKTVVEYVCEEIKSLFWTILAFTDMYVYTIYSKVRLIFFNGFIWGYTPFLSDIGKIPGLEPGFRLTIIPFHLDYFFFSYFLLTLFITKFIFLKVTFRGKTPKNILKNINSLNEIIVTEITTEKMAFEKSAINFFSFFSPKTRKRAIADVREIEKGLIDILDDLDQVRFPYSHPRTIIVLDELDKIEAHTPGPFGAVSERKELDLNNSHFIKYPNPSFTIDGTRERQQTLQVLLSNLKYFLSDARAKFIFIAGREMFDASLADISDRNYFMGSIFHDVIYVESFLSEDKEENPSDITSMIEKYICKCIIPENYLYKKLAENLKKKEREQNSIRNVDAEKEMLKNCSLETFNRYLIDEKIAGLYDDDQLPVYKRILNRQQREKIINLLQKFIIYLTHASNGAPKKITNYFENFVCTTKFPKTHNIIYVSNRDLNSVKSRKDIYLVFDFKQQYEIGLINYITLPVVLSINNHIKNFDDKILVSATYIFDHLLKFHHNGFSWRNIEYVPEILEVNKTPELRSFIGNIITYLTQTHLQVIISGLYIPMLNGFSIESTMGC